jgi:hypothetical protein
MDFANTNVYNIGNAIRGMRNPKNSWHLSDSEGDVIGPKDMKLAQSLIRGGSVHCKFLRQIFVSVDITAPMYFWSELDTYKVGTTADSTSKMHKLENTPITWDCFEHDDCTDDCLKLQVFDNEPYNPDDCISDVWDNIIDVCETLRKRFLKTGDKRYWKELIRILPESWLQTRTWTANYEVLRGMYQWRQHHKLTEWDIKNEKSMCSWIESLPYARELILPQMTLKVED